MSSQPHPVLHDLETLANLSPRQASGVLGVLLRKLKEHLTPTDWQELSTAFPEAALWMQHAPPPSSGLLGGLAALGGQKAKLLMEMNQAMHSLQIPTSQAQDIGRILQSSMEKHYPDLANQLRSLLG